MDNKTFMKLQIEEIKKHRWIESEKNKKDMTGIAEEDWVNKYAADYRKYMEHTEGPIE